jgi:DNA-binding beta-propeller fold protein YncE
MIYISQYKRFILLFIGVTILLLMNRVLLVPTPTHADGFPIVGVLHSGKAPEAMAVDTQTHLLYVAHESPGTLVAFNAVRGQVVWRVTLGDVVTDVQVDSESHLVFASVISYSRKESNLFVLSGSTGQTLAKQPTGFGDNGIALDASRHLVYVSSSDSGVVAAFTLTGTWHDTATLFSTIQVKQLHIGPHPQGLGVNSRLGRLYVADVSEHVLRVLNETTMQVMATLPLAAAPLHPVRVDETTGYVYIVCSTGQELDVVDGKKNVMIARIPVTPYPEGLSIDTATGRIYIAGEGNNEQGSGSSTGNTISVLDGKTFQPLGMLRVGAAPDGVASDADLHRVYVALENSDAVVEVSDSVNLPLTVNQSLYQSLDAHRAVELLRQASILTALCMLVTFATATAIAYAANRKRRELARTSAQERQRAMESPRTSPSDELSRAEPRSLHS